MSKDKEGFFGGVDSLPEEVEITNLTKPALIKIDTSSFQEAEEDKGEEDDFLSGAADAGMGELEREFDDDDLGGSSADGFELDDLEAEMILELWEDARINLHTFAYNQTLYKGAKEAKKLSRELSLKNSKTSEEEKLLKALWDYIEKCDECKGKYTEAIPYSERHKALCIRFIEYQIKKMKAQGKKVPEWLMWAYLFAAPEVKAISRLFIVKDEIPQFKFDPSTLNK